MAAIVHCNPGYPIWLPINRTLCLNPLTGVSTFKAQQTHTHRATNTSHCQMCHSKEILINVMHLILSCRSRPRKCNSIQLS